jgi:hypothetical protein
MDRVYSWIQEGEYLSLVREFLKQHRNIPKRDLVKLIKQNPNKTFMTSRGLVKYKEILLLMNYIRSNLVVA